MSVILIHGLKVDGTNWKLKQYAIACIFVGMPHLYFSVIQRGPKGSISLCRKGTNPLERPMLFINEQSANAVINVIVKAKKLSELFDWKVVEYERAQ